MRTCKKFVVLSIVAAAFVLLNVKTRGGSGTCPICGSDPGTTNRQEAVSFNPPEQVCDSPDTSAYECLTSTTLSSSEETDTYFNPPSYNTHYDTYYPCYTDDTECEPK
jgi:hypothetical protein